MKEIEKMNVEMKPETRMFELEVKLWGKMVILTLGPIEHCFAVLCDKFKKDRSCAICIGRHFKQEFIRVADGGVERGFTFSDGAGHIFIVMPKVAAICAGDIADLAHECLHAADIMLREEGVRNDLEAEEAFAYTQAFILSTFLNAIIESESKESVVAACGKPADTAKKAEVAMFEEGSGTMSIAQQAKQVRVPVVEVYVLNHVDVWGAPVFLVIGPNEQCTEIVLKALPKDYEHANFLKKKFADEVNPLMKNARSCGLQFCDDSGNIFMWMPSLDVNRVSNMSILVHECLHAANAILRNVGVVDYQESKEALAHTQQIIFHEFLKMMIERSAKRLMGAKSDLGIKGVSPKDELDGLAVRPTPARRKLGNAA